MDDLGQKLSAFNRKAASYDEHAIVQKEAAEWLAQWLPEASPDSTCLEFGAGTGLLTQYLPRHFTHVEASDLWSEMLDVCRMRVPGVDHVLRDAWASQKDIGCWDYLVSSSLLQWSPRPEDCMRQWGQLLKRKGRMLLGFFVQPTLPEMLSVVDSRSPVEWRSPEQWAAHFETTGLRIVRMETESRCYSFQSALHFWRSLHGTGATVSRKLLPSQIRKLFRDYEARFSDGKGVYATWSFCRVELARGDLP